MRLNYIPWLVAFLLLLVAFGARAETKFYNVSNDYYPQKVVHVYSRTVNNMLACSVVWEEGLFSNPLFEDISKEAFQERLQSLKIIFTKNLPNPRVCAYYNPTKNLMVMLRDPHISCGPPAYLLFHELLHVVGHDHITPTDHDLFHAISEVCYVKD